MKYKSRTLTVGQLVAEGALERPIDGNHGETHPKSQDYVPHGIPFIMASDLMGGAVDTTGCYFITEQQARSLRKGFSVTGDVLISHKATIGRTAIVPDIQAPFLMLTPQVTYYRIIDNNILDRRYLKYYFDSPDFQSLLKTWAKKGSTRDYLGITAQMDLPIVVPPIDVQHEIARLLEPFDKKLSLNQKYSTDLESAAHSLFQSWFITLESTPPGAERGKLVDSEIGKIPKGWTVHGLDQVAKFLNGLALQRFPPNGNNDLPVIKIAQIRSGSTKDADLSSDLVPQEYIIADGDILFSWSGSLECVFWSAGRGALNQHIFKVTSAGNPAWLCYFSIHHHLEEFRRIAAGKATTMGHIQRHHLTQAKMALPSAAFINKADRILAPMLEASWRRKVESRTLTDLRNTLLSSLISGEISLDEAVGGVAL